MMVELEATWSLIGRIAVLVATIVGLIKGCEYLFSFLPSAKLEKRVDKIEEMTKNDFEHIKDIDARLNMYEKRINETGAEIEQLNEGIQRIGESQITLLRHFVTGSGQKEMEDEADNLTRFFIGRNGKTNKE